MFIKATKHVLYFKAKHVFSYCYFEGAIEKINSNFMFPKKI